MRRTSFAPLFRFASLLALGFALPGCSKEQITDLQRRTTVTARLMNEDPGGQNIHIYRDGESVDTRTIAAGQSVLMELTADAAQDGVTFHAGRSVQPLIDTQVCRGSVFTNVDAPLHHPEVVWTGIEPQGQGLVCRDW